MLEGLDVPSPEPRHTMNPWGELGRFESGGRLMSHEPKVYTFLLKDTAVASPAGSFPAFCVKEVAYRYISIT